MQPEGFSYNSPRVFTKIECEVSTQVRLCCRLDLPSSPPGVNRHIFSDVSLQKSEYHTARAVRISIISESPALALRRRVRHRHQLSSSAVATS